MSEAKNLENIAVSHQWETFTDNTLLEKGSLTEIEFRERSNKNISKFGGQTRVGYAVDKSGFGDRITLSYALPKNSFLGISRTKTHRISRIRTLVRPSEYDLTDFHEWSGFRPIDDIRIGDIVEVLPTSRLQDSGFETANKYAGYVLGIHSNYFALSMDHPSNKYDFAFKNIVKCHFIDAKYLVRILGHKDLW